MSDEILPQSDRLGECPHPRETRLLVGQSDAETTLLDAFNTGKLHHAWLLTGPRGVGKATFAWRAAKFLIAHTPMAEAGLFGAPEKASTLGTASDHPVSRRVTAGSEPGLLSIKRSWDADRKRFNAQITVDEVRRLNGFFGLSASDGGYRVVIIDSADEMNLASANALLKVLEEPPQNAILFLVSHQPARLLPTIRSRCRELKFAALGTSSIQTALTEADPSVEVTDALSELAGGSVGEAIRIGTDGGVAIYGEILGLINDAPRMDRQRLAKLAESIAARGAERRLQLVFQLLDILLARVSLAGAGQPPACEIVEGESQIFRRLAPTLSAAREWAELSRDIGERTAHGRAVNVDPATLLMDAFFKINALAGRA